MAELTDPESRTEVAPLETPSGTKLTSAQDSAELIAGRYELLGMLGAGGMGTVYRARDRELDEIVALKVLRKELAASPSMLERFRREVKLARRVTHRNVARTFDIGEHGGDRFLTMEYVEGELLATRLGRSGRLGFQETVAVARDVCAGLAAAHAAGVLHRDLKGDNVVIALDGRAVITDFGIARAVAEGEATRTAGGFVGTPAYMAPEQVEGVADLDARADIYALGAMMYELLTGNAPWTGDSVFAIASARLMKPPPDPRALVPEIPTQLAELVLSLMARRREDRPASADDAAAALARVTGVEGKTSSPPPPMQARGVHKRTVAVLPLLNLGAADDAYLAQTVTEDIVDLLSVVPELRVRPRGESARHDSAARDVREIGRQLGVDVVVDGSLRRTGDQTRVSVRLVTVDDGFQLWAKRFDRPASEVLTVADVAAAAIGCALTSRDVAAPRAAAVSPVAQDLYLRGRYLLHRGWFEVSAQAVDLLRKAAEHAPEDARILGTLAIGLCRLYGFQRDGAETARQARTIADKAILLAPERPEGHVALGLLHLTNGEAAAAVRELKKALELAPNNVDALDALGKILIEVGRVERGLELLTQAVAIQPDLSVARQAMVRALGLLGLWDDALEAMGPIPTDQSDLPSHILVIARLHLWRGDAAAAAALGDLVDRLATPRAREAVTGFLRVATTLKVSDEDLAVMCDRLPVTSAVAARRAAFNAQIHCESLLACGRLEEGLEMLQTADANTLIDLVWLDSCPLFEPVRGRPEFAKVRANVSMRAKRALEMLDG
jgi:TolB-like protein/Flp pilus assembly protein TadD